MDIKSENKNIILICNETEAKAISSVLIYNREDCPADCPYLSIVNCRLTWRADHWEECAALGEKINTFLTLKKEGIL